MKAILVGPKFGADNITVSDVKSPSGEKGSLKVKITMAGMNPLDYNLINGKILYNLQPIPHIPGSEAIGTAMEDGKRIRKGDRVVIYNRKFDGTCRFCLSGREELCLNGGIHGVLDQGYYCEETVMPEKNLYRIPDGMSDELAVSLPIGGLTALHALNQANAEKGEKLLIFGGSGNTGIFASQIGKYMGMDVSVVSRKTWMKDYGASEIFKSGSVPPDYRADVVINSIGAQFWDESLSHLGRGGRIATFGVLTGRESKLDLGKIYTEEMKIVGSTGGTPSEFEGLLNISQRAGFKVRVHKKMDIWNFKEAISEYEKVRDGRILLRIE